MNQVNERIGSDYKPFNYYGAPDAENVIVAMVPCASAPRKSWTTSTLPVRRLAS